MTGRTTRWLSGALAVLFATRRDVAVRTAVVGLVAITAFAITGAPRRLDTMADRGLRTALAGAGETGRGVQLDRLDRIEPGSDGQPLANVEKQGRRDLARVPTRLRSGLVLADVVIDSARHVLSSLPGRRSVPYARFLTLRNQRGAAERIRYVAGRPPVRTSETVRVTDDRGLQTAAAVVEVALSRDNARQLDLGVGESAVLTPDNTEAVTRASTTDASLQTHSERPFVVRVVAVFEIVNPTDPYWTPTGLPRAVREEKGERLLVRGFALFEPPGYADVRAAMPALVMHYTWRYELDPASVDGGDLSSLQRDVAELGATTPSSGDAVVGRTTSRTGLLPLLDRVQNLHSFARSVLAVVLIGLLGVALILLTLVALLAAEGRRQAIGLIRGRGGSSGQVVGAQLIEGAVLCFPAALAGTAGAITLVRDRAGHGVGVELLLALGFGAGAALLLAAAVVPHARRDLRRLARGDLADGGLSPRRLVLEGLVVVIALAGVAMLRRRALTGVSSRTDAGVDVYLAAVPLLLGLAAGLLTLRAYPAPVRLLSRVAARRRGAVGFLALSRAARAPAVTAVPLLVLLLAVAVSTFASVVSHTVTTSQQRAAWREVGADYRIDAPEGGALAPRLDVADVPGVQSTARAYVEPDTAVGRPASELPALLLAVDAPALLTVVNGTPAEVELPRSFVEGPADDGGLLPVMVSAQLADDQRLRAGNQVTLTVAGRPVAAVVVAVLAHFPGQSVDRSFVLAPLTALSARAPTMTNRLYVRATDEAGSALDAALRARSPDAVVASRSGQYAAAARTPVTSWMVATLTGTEALAALYAALGIIVGMTLTARSRAQDLAYLRTLGLADQQARGMVVAEIAPMVAVSALLGGVLGVTTAALVTPRLGLGQISGSLGQVTPSVSAGILAAEAGALVVVVALAIGVAEAMARRTGVATTLRVGEQ